MTQLVLNSLIMLSFPPLSLNMERELGSLILATDISRQNDYLSRFRSHLDQENLCLSNGSHRQFILQVGYLLVYTCTSASQQDSNFVFIPIPYRWL